MASHPCLVLLLIIVSHGLVGPAAGVTYFLYPGARTWNDAKCVCSAGDSVLLRLATSDAYTNAVPVIFSQTAWGSVRVPDQVWVGLYDQDAANGLNRVLYVWYPDPSPAPWNPDPSGRKQDECTAISTSAWLKQTCNLLLPFVCMQDSCLEETLPDKVLKPDSATKQMESSLQACREACSSFSQCHAFHFAAPWCWVYTSASQPASASDIPTDPQSGVNVYFRRCSATVIVYEDDNSTLDNDSSPNYDTPCVPPLSSEPPPSTGTSKTETDMTSDAHLFVPTPSTLSLTTAVGTSGPSTPEFTEDSHWTLSSYETTKGFISMGPSVGSVSERSTLHSSTSTTVALQASQDFLSKILETSSLSMSKPLEVTQQDLSSFSEVTASSACDSSAWISVPIPSLDFLANSVTSLESSDSLMLLEPTPSDAVLLSSADIPTSLLSTYSGQLSIAESSGSLNTFNRNSLSLTTVPKPSLTSDFVSDSTGSVSDSSTVQSIPSSSIDTSMSSPQHFSRDTLLSSRDTSVDTSDVMSELPEETTSLMTQAPATSSAPAPALTRQCHCPCVRKTTQTEEQLAELVRELTVEKNTTSASRRKKISIPDTRMSAHVIGYVGVVIVVVTCSIPLVVDAVKVALSFRKN